MDEREVENVNVETVVTENEIVNEQVVTNKPKKKKSWKGLIITIILILLVLTLGSAAFYLYEYKSAPKRLEYLANSLFSFKENVKQERIELASGKYEVALKVKSGDEELSTEFNGTYGIDIKNKILDYTLNLSSLNMTEELLPSELNVELYSSDNNLYVYAKKFYDKYVYVEVPEMDKLFEELAKQDDEYYTDIIDGINEALVASVGSLETTQTVKDVEINDKKVKANVITVEFTKKNQEKFVTTFMNSIYENKKLIASLADITDTDEDELKEEIKKSIDELKSEEFEDEDMTIEIYSSLFGKELLGIKMYGENDEGDDCSLELYVIEDGFTLEFIQDKESIFKAEVVAKTKEDSKTITTEYKIDLTIASDDNKVKISLDAKVEEDVKPNVEKRNIKNSVKVEELTESDYQKIYDNVSSYGTLGKYLESFIEAQSSSSSSGSESSIIMGDESMFTPSSNCVEVDGIYNCTSSVVDEE